MTIIETLTSALGIQGCVLTPKAVEIYCMPSSHLRTQVSMRWAVGVLAAARMVSTLRLVPKRGERSSVESATQGSAPHQGTLRPRLWLVRLDRKIVDDLDASGKSADNEIWGLDSCVDMSDSMSPTTPCLCSAGQANRMNGRMLHQEARFVSPFAH